MKFPLGQDWCGFVRKRFARFWKQNPFWTILLDFTVEMRDYSPEQGVHMFGKFSNLAILAIAMFALTTDSAKRASAGAGAFAGVV